MYQQNETMSKLENTKKNLKPYGTFLKWVGIVTPLILSPLVFNHINPWVGLICAGLSIVLIAQSLIKSLNK